LTIWPSTLDFTSTLLNGRTAPKPVKKTGTSPCLTVVATTGWLAQILLRRLALERKAARVQLRNRPNQFRP
jgi:hypothetical protein